MTKEQIRKLVAESLTRHGLEILSFQDGEIWLRGQLVARHGQVIQ